MTIRYFSFSILLDCESLNEREESLSFMCRCVVCMCSVQVYALTYVWVHICEGACVHAGAIYSLHMTSSIAFYVIYQDWVSC